VLEIGTGSGYAAAVLAEIACDVYTIERYRELCESARTRLEELGYDNVKIRCGDGSVGWAEHAPFDGILVSAGAPDVPTSLRDQLAVGGRLVLPVGSSQYHQQLVRVVRKGPDKFKEDRLGGVRFVPLVGEEGWDPDSRERPGWLL
jgi:protein-L-isoaspartate(D-aspartate) O-methyltransferase